jgi:hypothetical protein
LLDLSISYPVVDEQIPIGLLAVIALVIPAVIIFLIVAALVPGPRTTRGLSRKTMITRKLWEWEKGWAGLALALVVSFFITQGMKNLFGKPRPSCIARCQPDLDNVQNYVVGGYGQNLDPRWTLVSADICKNPDAHLVVTLLSPGLVSSTSSSSSAPNSPSRFPTFQLNHQRRTPDQIAKAWHRSYFLCTTTVSL